MKPTTYQRDRRRTSFVCTHCHLLPDAHHADGRCPTLADVQARVAWRRQHGRWPESGEEDEERRDRHEPTPGPGHA